MAKGNSRLFVPKTLLTRIERRQCVAFVGAGFSMSCGMPRWHDLLTNLLEFAKESSPNEPGSGPLHACEATIADGNLALAASMIRDLITPSDLDELIRHEFGLLRLHQAEPGAQKRTYKRIENLIKAPWAGIVTTNYDELIEHGIKLHHRGDLVEATGNVPRLGTILAQPPTGNFFFVKIHGSVSGSEIVLSTEEYDRIYLAAPQMTAFLTALMLRYHLVFVGCSLEDEILRLRRALCQHFKRVVPLAYALLPDDPRNRSRLSWLRTQAMVECLLYSAADHTHQAVDEFLAAAAACANDPAKPQEIGATQGELRMMKTKQRLGAIGSINRELIKVVVGQPNHTLPHLSLIKLEHLKSAAIDQALLETTEAERTYRMFFLVSIGLVTEERLEDGTHIYRVLEKEVIESIEQ